MSEPQACPCGSGDTYVDCCRPFHDGRAAPSALALMRSRYSAYALGDAGYLRRTWHRTARPARLSLDDGVQWLRLHVVDTEDGGPADDTGVVEFVARYRTGDRSGSLRERSEFVREDGRWFYVRGDIAPA